MLSPIVVVVVVVVVVFVTCFIRKNLHRYTDSEMQKAL